MVEREYNSIALQNRVKNYLNSLRLSHFAAEVLDPAASLGQVYKLITTLARQVPLGFRGDAHRVEFLRKSVIGDDCASEPLSRIATQGLTFPQLYSEMEFALSLDREAKLAKVQDVVTRKLNKAHANDIIGLNVQVQGPTMRQQK